MRSSTFAASACMVLISAAPAAAGCDGWLTAGFWRDAGAAQVAACLDAAAEVTARTDAGKTPLHLAAGHASRASALRTLIRAGAPLDVIDSDGREPVHAAAADNPDPSVMLNLILAGADPETRIGQDTCRIGHCATAPLHLAAARGEAVEVAAALLVAGALTKRLDSEQRTPLHIAALSGSGVGMIRVLLAAGAAPDATDEDGKTPLHLAADADGAPGLVRLLTAAGASADTRDKEGNTPLHLAAARSTDPRVFDLLADAAEKPCTLNDRDITALDVHDARWKRDSEAGKAPALPRDATYWSLLQTCRGGNGGE